MGLAGIDTYRSDNVKLLNWDVTCGDDCLAFKGVRALPLTVRKLMLNWILEHHEPPRKEREVSRWKWYRFRVVGSIRRFSEQNSFTLELRGSC